MRRRPRIDAILERPAARADLEELKRLFGLSADRYQAGDQDGHYAAALQGREVAFLIVASIRAEPLNATLPEEAVYRYIANVAHLELLGEQAKADDVKLFELGVRLPAGRPPRSRARAREGLIEALRGQPDMPDWRLEDLGRTLGVWAEDQAIDGASPRRRIKRIRADAAK